MADAVEVEAAAAAQEAEDLAERDERAPSVEALEKSVTTSAKKAAEEGVLEGPTTFSSCTATGGASGMI